jgi:hypothetical protein
MQLKELWRYARQPKAPGARAEIVDRADQRAANVMRQIQTYWGNVTGADRRGPERARDRCPRGGQ